MDNLITNWKKNRKGKLIQDVTKRLNTRSGLTCKHCDRRYDDDMCNKCFSVLLVNMFQDSLNAEGDAWEECLSCKGEGIRIKQDRQEGAGK